MRIGSTDPIVKKCRSWTIRLLRLAGAMAVCYVGGVALLLFLENHLIYRPVRASEHWTDPKDLRVEDVNLVTEDGTAIHAWWCPRDKASGAVLYCHGIGGNLSTRAHLVSSLLEGLNESVLIFDYPGFGRSSGEPTEAGCYAAADAAHNWLVQTKNVPGERILILGESLGGGVAVELASRGRPHRALVLVKTFTSIPDVACHHIPLLPTHWLMSNRFDNLAKIGRCRRPIFIAHGTSDDRIPFQESEQLHAAANVRKRFFAMPGIHHRGPLLTEKCVDELHRFLAEADE